MDGLAFSWAAQTVSTSTSTSGHIRHDGASSARWWEPVSPEDCGGLKIVGFLTDIFVVLKGKLHRTRMRLDNAMYNIVLAHPSHTHQTGWSFYCNIERRDQRIKDKRARRGTSCSSSRVLEACGGLFEKHSACRLPIDGQLLPQQKHRTIP